MKYETIARFDEIDALRKQAELAESELARVRAELEKVKAESWARHENSERIGAENARLRGELEDERRRISEAPSSIALAMEKREPWRSSRINAGGLPVEWIGHRVALVKLNPEELT